MHNWAALDKMGIDTSYMRKQDAYEAAQQALKASKSSSSRSSGSRSTYSGVGGNIDGDAGGNEVVNPVSPTPQSTGNGRSQLSYQDVVNQYNNTANKVQFKAWLDLMNQQGVVSDNDYIKAMSALGLNQANSSNGNFMQRFF